MKYLPKMFWVGVLCGLSILLFVAAGGPGTIHGSGTPGTVPLWIAPTTLGDSLITSDNSNGIIGIGIGALDGAVMVGATSVFAAGNDALRVAQLINQSGSVVALGRLALEEANLDQASQIYAIGDSSLKRASLTTSTDIFAIGVSAGFEMSGTFHHVFLAGSGATATGDNQWVAGDARYGYKFPGTNGFEFGASASPPVNAVTPATWVSVQVSGDPATYRLPLYK